jgi:hypothetical protein
MSRATLRLRPSMGETRLDTAKLVSPRFFGLELLQVGHCSNRIIGTDPKMNRRMQFSARPET